MDGGMRGNFPSVEKRLQLSPIQPQSSAALAEVDLDLPDFPLKHLTTGRRTRKFGGEDTALAAEL